MTEEQKQLLLQDLCARLPYRVKCHYNCVISYDTMVISKANAEGELKGIIPLSDGHIGFMVDYDKINALEGDIKPYLRPMSSMTEEERKEYNKVMFQSERYEDNYAVDVDWLNRNHFDYRGLIEKDLAIEAPEGMYNQNYKKMPYRYFPIEFSSYEDYVKYLKEKGFAIDVTDRKE